MNRKTGMMLLALCFLIAMVALNLIGQASERPPGLSEQTAKAVPPFKMFDNLYYVGLDFVCSYVIQTSGGLILVDTLFGLTEKRLADARAKAENAK